MYFLCYVNVLAEVHHNRLVCAADGCFVSNLWLLHTHSLERGHSAQSCSLDATSDRTSALFENCFSIKAFLN